jgi:hypothetical protein
VALTVEGVAGSVGESAGADGTRLTLQQFAQALAAPAPLIA